MDGKQNNPKKLLIKDIVLIALLAALLFVQEEALTFLPNVQLTVFLLVLYSKKMGFFKTTIILIIHVLLDNLVMGSLNLFYTPTMFIGWMFIPILICSLGKKTENPIILSLLAALCSFLYCWSYILPSVFVYKISVISYLTADILFELILAFVGFVTTLLLYKPCSKLFDHYKIH